MKDSRKFNRYLLIWIAVAALMVTLIVPMAPSVSAAESRDNPTNTPSEEKTSQRNKVVIIIDDFGNGMKGTDEMFSLPIKLTVAVMPFLPTSVKDATRAHERGDDVLVHLPMEPRQVILNGLDRELYWLRCLMKKCVKRWKPRSIMCLMLSV